MVIMAVQHRFQDYEAWKKVFDSFPPLNGGAKFHTINRMVGDPNMVLVVTGFESEAEAQAFRANPGLADAIKRSGIIGQPRIELYEEAEFVEY